MDRFSRIAKDAKDGPRKHAPVRAQADAAAETERPDQHPASVIRRVKNAQVPLTSADVLNLHRVVGNRAVQRLLAARTQPHPLPGVSTLSSAASRQSPGVAGAVQRAPGDDIQAFKDAGHRAIIPAGIHQGQQDKHIASSANYKNAVKGGVHKSVLTVDAATLLANFHAGQYTVLAYKANSIVVNFGATIGNILNEADGTLIAASQYGSLRWNSSGVHIFPLQWNP